MLSLARNRRRMDMSRTVVDLRDDLMERARLLTGLKKKVEIVNLALERLVSQKELEEIVELKGSVYWAGNLKQMRKNRVGSG